MIIKLMRLMLYCSNLAFQHRRIDDQSMISLNETGASSRGTMDIMNPIFDRNAARNHDDDDDDEGATVRIYGNANREFVVDYKVSLGVVVVVVVDVSNLSFPCA